MYVYEPYPKWIYKEGQSLLVKDAEEHAQYGDWLETPDCSTDAAQEPQPEPAKRRGRPPKVPT